MTCERFKVPGRNAYGFMCGTFDRDNVVQLCACGADATKLCDAPGCDAPICDEHATQAANVIAWPDAWEIRALRRMASKAPDPRRRQRAKRALRDLEYPDTVDFCPAHRSLA